MEMKLCHNGDHIRGALLTVAERLGQVERVLYCPSILDRMCPHLRSASAAAWSDRHCLREDADFLYFFVHQVIGNTFGTYRCQAPSVTASDHAARPARHKRHKTGVVLRSATEQSLEADKWRTPEMLPKRAATSRSRKKSATSSDCFVAEISASAPLTSSIEVRGEDTSRMGHFLSCSVMSFSMTVTHIRASKTASLYEHP